MSKSIKISIDEFVNELQARIDLLNSSLVSSNVSSNKESIEKIQEIVKLYTETPLQNLTISDVYSISLIDIKKLLKLIGRSSEYIEETLEMLKKNGKDLNIYEAIRKMIVDYVSEFYSMQKSQGAVISNSIQEYQRIIDLLSTDSTFELADDINHLMNIMNSVNLANDSKGKILAHIANKNSQNYIEKMNYDISKLMNSMMSKYYPEKDSLEYKIISEYPFRGDESVSEISVISSKLCRKTKCSYSLVYNSILAYLANLHLEEFYGEDNISKKTELKDYITSLIQSIIGIEEEIIQTSSASVDEYLDIFESLKEEGYTSYEEYEKLSLDELSVKYGSIDIAIQLKKSAIIKNIIENIQTIKSIDLRNLSEEEEEEYYLTLDKLSELGATLDEFEEIEKVELEKIKG